MVKEMLSLMEVLELITLPYFADSINMQNLLNHYKTNNVHLIYAVIYISQNGKL
jgi:hypothetical protein